MKKNNIKDFSKEDLYLVRDFIETQSDIKTMLSEVDEMILEKEKKENDMNHRLTIELMEQLHFFDSEMIELLKKHGIKNIQDLLDSDLSTWKDLEKYRREELEEEMVWYDFSHLDETIEKEKQKKKNKK